MAIFGCSNRSFERFEHPSSGNHTARPPIRGGPRQGGYCAQVRELQDFEHRVQVLALYLTGKTETEIAEETGIVRQTVNRWLEEFQNMDTQNAQMSVLGIHHLDDEKMQMSVFVMQKLVTTPQQTVNDWLKGFQNLSIEKAQMSVSYIQSLVTTPPDRLK